MIKEEDIFDHKCGIFSWFSLTPTGFDKCLQSETDLLRIIPGRHEDMYICNEEEKYSIRTHIFRNYEKDDFDKKTPIFLVHGFGAGSCLWFKNIGDMASTRRVYAIDLLGYGLSTRKPFPAEPEDIEDAYIKSIDTVMKALDLTKVILIGHSFGGYLSSAFALKHPEKIEHLILVDAWGFVENNDENLRPIHRVLLRLPTPLGLLRHTGYAGPYFLKKFRPDFATTFGPEGGPSGSDKIRYTSIIDAGYLADETDDTDINGGGTSVRSKGLKRSQTSPSSMAESETKDWQPDTVYNYIYHCNMREPTGEAAFYGLCKKNFYAKLPMTPRLKDAEESIPMTFIYGGRSWIDSSSGIKVKGDRPNSYVDIKIIQTGGHQAFAQCASEFNEMVRVVCIKIDAKFDFNSEDTKKFSLD